MMLCRVVKGEGVPERVCGRCFVRLLDDRNVTDSSPHDDVTTVDAQEEAVKSKTPYECMQADPAYAKYFRMLQMGVNAAVRVNHLPLSLVWPLKGCCVYTFRLWCKR